MVQFRRLGLVLEPATSELRTYATFNADCVLASFVVHTVSRYWVWPPAYDVRRQSPCAVEDTRYASLTLLYGAKELLVAPSLAWDYSGCYDARVIPFEGEYHLVYCEWDKSVAVAGEERPPVRIARTKDFRTAGKRGIIGSYTWDKDAFFACGPETGGCSSTTLSHRRRSLGSPTSTAPGGRSWTSRTRQSGVARLPYEVYGDVENVVIPVGACIRGDDLSMCYGRVVAMTKTPVDELSAELGNDQV